MLKIRVLTAGRHVPGMAPPECTCHINPDTCRHCNPSAPPWCPLLIDYPA